MFRYVPRVIPTKIFVIGCGGTGSRLVPLLAQFMKTVTAGANPRGTVVDPVIYLIDFDTVETKNLQRQNFIAADVGKNKAEVLAQRYGRAYGVNIIPIVKRVTAGPTDRPTTLFRNLEVEPEYPGENSLVIMCVDSAQARRDIITAWSPDRMRRSGPDRPEIFPVFIDAGNEDDFGQVRIFQRGNAGFLYREDAERLKEQLPKMRPEVMDIYSLPMDVEFYQNLQDNEGGSCADLDQTLAINALMATLIMGMVQNLYYFKPFTYHSMGISLSGGVSVQHLTAEYLLGLAGQVSSLGRTPACFLPITVMDEYIARNSETLARMGLGVDGKPLAASAVAVEETSEQSAQEEVQEATVIELQGEQEVHERQEDEDAGDVAFAIAEPAVATAPPLRGEGVRWSNTAAASSGASEWYSSPTAASILQSMRQAVQDLAPAREALAQELAEGMAQNFVNDVMHPGFTIQMTQEPSAVAIPELRPGLVNHARSDQ